MADNLLNLSPPQPPLYQTFLASIGLGEPYMRVLVGFALGSVLSYIFHSSAMYDEMGARPFVFLTDDKVRGTYIPWYATGIILGFIFAFLI